MKYIHAFMFSRLTTIYTFSKARLEYFFPIIEKHIHLLDGENGEEFNGLGLNSRTCMSSGHPNKK